LVPELAKLALSGLSVVDTFRRRVYDKHLKCEGNTKLLGAILVSLSLLLSQHDPATRKAQRTDPTQPLPLYHERESPGHLCFFGRHAVLPPANCSSGVNCYLSNGNSVHWSFSTTAIPFSVWFAIPIASKGNHLVKLLLGSQSGLVGEVDLGEGATALIDLRGPFPFCRLGLNWCPIEGACFTVSLDVMHGQTEYGWEGDDNPIGVLGTAYQGIAFALYMSGFGR
jgi:hypothetical protein